MTSQTWWYVARAGGIVAWALAAATVLWGLALSSGVLGRRGDLRKLTDLHRYLGGLCVAFVAVHLLGLALDETLDVGAAGLFVPMASRWEPAAVAWGVVALYLLVAVEITSLLRSRLGERAWRLVHYGGFAVFLLGTIHGLGVGSDVENPLIWWPAAIVSAAIVGLCVYRVLSGDPVRVTADGERVPASVLERTLSELERLDTDAYPRPGASVPVPSPAVEPTAAGDAAGDDPPPTSVEAPAVDDGPMFPRLRRGATPQGPPVPSRHAPPPPPDADAPIGAATLPARTPRRLAATTAPASGLGAWRPSDRPADESVTGPPPPPAAVDPVTGEPDPYAYRKWLREWLAYVESQP